MILYDYQCNRCHHQFEAMNTMEKRYEALCPKCGSAAALIITNYHNRDWFRPGYWEDFGDEPIYVKSRSHLKELCFKHGVYSKALGPIDDRRGV